MTTRRKIIVGAIVAAVAAILFFALREPDPQAVLRHAQVQLAAEKTMHVELVGTLLAPPPEVTQVAADSATGVGVVIKANLDRSDAVHPASDASFDITQGEGPGRTRLAGQARRKADAYYLHLDAAEGVTDPNVPRLIGLWAKSDRPLTELLFPPTDADLAEHPLDAAGVSAMRMALSAVDLFKVDKRLAKQKIDGRTMRHYAGEMDLQALSALLLKERTLRSAAALTAEDVNAVTKRIVALGKPFGEVWIDARDGKVRRMKLQTQLSEGSTLQIGAMLQADFSRYGQPVHVDAPQAKDLRDLLGATASGRLSLSGERPVPAEPIASATESVPLAPGQAAMEADSDGDGLADGQESFYGSDAFSPDTDADGWPDGLEVDKGMNPVGPGSLFGFGL